jgi:hypothetical protein
MIVNQISLLAQHPAVPLTTLSGKVPVPLAGDAGGTAVELEPPSTLKVEDACPVAAPSIT